MNAKTPGEELKSFVQPIQKYLEERGFLLMDFMDTIYTGRDHDYAEMVFANRDHKIILKYYYNLSVFYNFTNYTMSHPDLMERLGHSRWKEALFTDYPPATIQEAIDNLLHDWNLFFPEIFKNVNS